MANNAVCVRRQITDAPRFDLSWLGSVLSFTLLWRPQQRDPKRSAWADAGKCRESLLLIFATDIRILSFLCSAYTLSNVGEECMYSSITAHALNRQLLTKLASSCNCEK
jgi:hypothetical protein